MLFDPRTGRSNRRVSYTLPRWYPRDAIVHFQAGRREWLEGHTASLELNVGRSIRKAFGVDGQTLAVRI